MPKVKIAHLTSVHAVSDNRILLKECRTLAEAGYEVVLIAPLERGGEKGKEIAGVRIRAVPKPARGRLERMTRTTWQVFRAALQERASIYHFHDPELLPWGLALRLLGRRVIYDIHEDYVTAMGHARHFSRPIGAAVGRLVAAIEVAASSVLQTVVAERYYLRRFPNSTAILNLPRIEKFRGLPRRTGTTTSPSKLRLLYTGNVTVARGALICAELAAHLKKDAHVHVIGACSPELAERMRVRAAAGGGLLSLDGVGVPHVPFERILAAYNEPWTAGLAIFPDNPHYREKELTKFFEYMAAGLPIVCSHFPVWRELVEDEGVGICVDPDSVQDIVSAVRWLQAHPRQAEEMGRRGREAVEKRFNWACEGRKLVDLYRRLLAAA